MVKLGDRVKIKGLYGVVRFVGETKFSAGQWVGIELDDAVGKNDGSVQGVSYFTMSKKNGLYGLFTRLETVSVISDQWGLTRSKLPSIKATAPNSSSSSGGTSSITVASRQSDSQVGYQMNLQHSPMVAKISRPTRRHSTKSAKGSVVPASTQSLIPRSSGSVLSSLTEDGKIGGSSRSQQAPPSLATFERRSAQTESTEEQRLRKVIEKLQEKLVTLRSECKILQDKLAEGNHPEKVETLIKDLELLTISKESLEEEKDELKNRLESLEEGYANVAAELVQYKDEVDLRRKIDLEELSKEDLSPNIVWKQNELMKDALMKIQESLDASSQLVVELQQEKKELLQTNTEMSNEIKELTLQLEQARSTINDLAAQVDAEGKVSAIVESLTTENLALTEEIEELKRELSEISRKDEFNGELEQLYKDLEKELSQQIHSLQLKISDDEIVMNKLNERNQELVRLLDVTQAKDEPGCIVDELKNTILDLESDKLRLKLTTEFLNQKISAHKPNPLEEYHLQLGYMATIVANNTSYDLNISVAEQINLFYLSIICKILYRLFDLKLVDEETVHIVIDAIPLEEWINRCLNDQTLKIEPFEHWIKILECHPLLAMSANIFYEVILRVCVDIIPNLLANLRNTLSAQDMQTLYSCFQALEKKSLSVLEDASLSSNLASFKLLNANSLLSNIFIIVNKTLSNGAPLNAIPKLQNVLKTLDESEIETIDLVSPVVTEQTATLTPIDDEASIDLKKKSKVMKNRCERRI
ncbi:Nip100p Ecym_2368 [Eremothecium cymbalariae DBVPG|uniref:CAP-Gly domain-containing protein n=1 Tax=Eremothecium cymbalariae (strain CBS 270.75 / DBVPG 7215 / KCTC 17166 / NRRL Y-17582) TaxID=931890 RepID=G8JNN3_ERECY|nr:Hypothetical protein Ecym_2368 [Eremothecium cymbalariae DBVPG\